MELKIFLVLFFFKVEVFSSGPQPNQPLHHFSVDDKCMVLTLHANPQTFYGI